jgi:hypothetical protein
VALVNRLFQFYHYEVRRCRRKGESMVGGFFFFFVLLSFLSLLYEGTPLQTEETRNIR